MATGAIHSRSNGGIIIRADGMSVGEITAMNSVPSPAAEQIEVTHFQSTHKEYLSDLPDSGEASFSVNLNPEDNAQRKLYHAAGTGDVLQFEIELPYDNPVTLSFMALVKSFVISAPTGEAVTAELTLKVTGQLSGFPGGA